MSLQVVGGRYSVGGVWGGELIGGIALKIAGRKNPCDYAVIAVGLAEVMERILGLGGGGIILKARVISNYAVITGGAAVGVESTNPPMFNCELVDKQCINHQMYTKSKAQRKMLEIHEKCPNL